MQQFPGLFSGDLLKKVSNFAVVVAEPISSRRKKGRASPNWT